MRIDPATPHVVFVHRIVNGRDRVTRSYQFATADEADAHERMLKRDGKLKDGEFTQVVAPLFDEECA